MNKTYRNFIALILIMTVLPAAFACSKAPESGAPVSDITYTEIITELKGSLSSTGEQTSLEAILTMPKTSGSPPVIVMIPGSGPNDMDETIGENKPFADIAHGLAQRGIATFRFNKRTFEHPEELSGHPTVQDEILNDASNAVKQMASDKSLGNIYVLGHSHGAMLAPIIAEQNPEVCGLVLMAGSPRKFEEILYDQNAASVAAANISAGEKEKLMSEVKTITDQIAAAKSGDDGLILDIDASYWASLNELDAKGALLNLNIPILILQGDQDVQISADIDYSAYKELLQNKDNVIFNLYPDLNHLFIQGTKEGGIAEYQIPSVVDPQVIEDISTFIKEQDAKITQEIAEN